MIHCPAVSLLEAIRNDSGVEVTFDRTRFADGQRGWLVAARSDDGQIYRSQHADLLLAVVMLEKLLRSHGLRR